MQNWSGTIQGQLRREGGRGCQPGQRNRALETERILTTYKNCENGDSIRAPRLLNFGSVVFVGTEGVAIRTRRKPTAHLYLCQRVRKLTHDKKYNVIRSAGCCIKDASAFYSLLGPEENERDRRLLHTHQLPLKSSFCFGLCVALFLVWRLP